MDRWTRWMMVASALLALMLGEAAVLAAGNGVTVAFLGALLLTALSFLNRRLWRRSQAARHFAQAADATPEAEQRLGLVEQELQALQREQGRLQEALAWQEQLLRRADGETVSPEHGEALPVRRSAVRMPAGAGASATATRGASARRR